MMAVVDAAQSGEVTILEQMGIDAGTAEQLRQLPLDVLTRGKGFRASMLRIQVNKPVVGMYINHISKESQNESHIDQAIRLGLRQPMLNALCGLSRREYDNRRNFLGLPPHSTGRIKALGEEDEIEVYERWLQLYVEQPGASLLERLIMLSEQTGHRADAIWTSLDANDVEWV